MQAKQRVVAFEGGRLRDLAGSESGREGVLALPLNRLVARLVKVAPGEDAATVAAAVLKAASPFPDDTLTVGLEKIRDDASGAVYIAAALPEDAADDIGEALDATKLRVTRIDALVLGSLRGVWNAIGTEENTRKLALFEDDGALALIALDGDEPVALRAIDPALDLRREIMLSLLEAEDFGGAKPLKEIILITHGEGQGENNKPVERPVGPQIANEAQPNQAQLVVSTADPIASQLAMFAPVRRVQVGEDAALVGVQERADDPEALDARPASWREMLEEARFKTKLIKRVAAAAAVWALAMGVLFGVPIAYGFMTDYQKGLSKQHQKQYRAVREMKEKTEIVRKYSDHARGALEIMKALSDRLPEGIELSSWNYRREEGVSVAGEAADANAIYKFKDAMESLGTESNEEGEEEGEKIFPTVDLKGPSASKNGQRFSIDCFYKTDENESD